MTNVSMRDLLADQEWDMPFFKILAPNDTPETSGHQSGVVIPKSLRRFLPSLDENVTSQHSPTVDTYIFAELLVGFKRFSNARIRYQLQTWRGTRAAESRMTDGLRAFREIFRAGDILVFQRHFDSLGVFRILLLSEGSQEYTEIFPELLNRKWGPVYLEEPPVSQTDIRNANKEILNISSNDFNLLRSDILKVESRQTRIARCSVFSARVRREYNNRCAVSGISIASPGMIYEVDAAHIVPLHLGGCDDIRNGISLSKSIHWAFDQGLMGILPSRKVYIPARAKKLNEGEFLCQYEGNEIAEAQTSGLRAHKDALTWHLQNVVSQWE